MHVSRRANPIITLPLMLALAGCEVGLNADVRIEPGSESGAVAVINGRIEVGAGARIDGDLSTVNGPVTVAERAVVERISTINGDVTLGPAAMGDDVRTVNGDITLGPKSVLSGSVELVQGDIRLEPGARIEGDVDSVAGSLRLLDAQVGGNVTTVSADVTLGGASMIAGDLRIENGKSPDAARPRIVVGPGSVIEGRISLDEPAEIYVSESGRIGGVEGAMTIDEVVRFAGPEPGPQ